MMIQKIIIPIILILLFLRITQIDQKDNTQPFGTDDEKNKKINVKHSDENGVQTFWGKYYKSDNINESLKKIKFLTLGSEKEIIWRKALIGSCILTLILSFFINEISTLLLLFFLGFLINYFLLGYFIRHNLFYKNNFILKHLKNIKNKITKK